MKIIIAISKDELDHSDALALHKELLEKAPPNVEVVLEEVTTELNGVPAEVVYIDDLKTNFSTLLPPKIPNISFEVEQKKKIKGHERPYKFHK